MGRGAIQMRVSMGGFLEEVRPREQEAGPAGIWEEPAFQAQHFLGLPASLLPRPSPSPSPRPSHLPTSLAVPSARGQSFRQNWVHSDSASLARRPARQELTPPCPWPRGARTCVTSPKLCELGPPGPMTRGLIWKWGLCWGIQLR